MTDLRTAAEQLLTALDEWREKGGPIWQCDPFITALRAALAEPVQRKPLTEEEIKACEKQAMVNGALPFEQRLFFARVIEKTHGIE